MDGDYLGIVRFFVGIGLVLGGIVAIAQFQRWDVGLAMGGFGVLLLGIQGEGGIHIGGWKVWGPVGLVLIGLGAVLYYMSTVHL